MTLLLQERRPPGRGGVSGPGVRVVLCALQRLRAHQLLQQLSSRGAAHVSCLATGHESRLEGRKLCDGGLGKQTVCRLANASAQHEPA